MSEFLQLSVDELEALELSYPLVKELKKAQPVLWLNPLKGRVVNTVSKEALGTEEISQEEVSVEEVIEANQRLLRFAPFLQTMFPETKASSGLIESPLQPLKSFMQIMMPQEMMSKSQWLVKLDSHLPISGSIKARGGIYEVLQHAEKLAIEAGLLTESDDYSILATPEFKTFFSKYGIAVGSTGNLGLSIGIMSAAFGFRVTVHMSSDAKQWKKDMLRSKGVEVLEYDADYSKAVEAGRAIADLDPLCYFVDDENSKTLFLGYATAALRLKEQLSALDIIIDSEHPLFVYLPCGVGGGPGGVAWGLQKFLGKDVHCFFAEPVQSPCMLLGMMTGKQDAIAVNDIGLTNKTIADGLAVGRASGFVGKIMAPFLSGIYTVTDAALTEALVLMYETEGLKLEPSALAGTYGPRMLMTAEEGQAYYSKVTENAKKVTHISWATGGSMVPEEEFSKYMK